MTVRLFFKPEGTNPEIEGPYYELSNYINIAGHSNLESFTLGFKKGSRISEMRFRPIDPTKPMVLAVNDHMDAGFIYIDQHLKKGAVEGMKDHKIYKTDKFLIDCRIKVDEPGYWSITSSGMTFVYSERVFPGTWTISDCDLLCAFVAGELSANQLRMNAYLTLREAVKEIRREEHIRWLTRKLECLQEELHEANSAVESSRDSLSLSYKNHKMLIARLKLIMTGWFPFISKAEVLAVIESNS